MFTLLLDAETTRPEALTRGDVRPTPRLLRLW